MHTQQTRECDPQCLALRQGSGSIPCYHHQVQTPVLCRRCGTLVFGEAVCYAPWSPLGVCGSDRIFASRRGFPVVALSLSSGSLLRLLARGWWAPFASRVGFRTVVGPRLPVHVRAGCLGQRGHWGGLAALACPKLEQWGLATPHCVSVGSCGFSPTFSLIANELPCCRKCLYR